MRATRVPATSELLDVSAQALVGLVTESDARFQLSLSHRARILYLGWLLLEVAYRVPAARVVPLVTMQGAHLWLVWTVYSIASEAPLNTTAFNAALGRLDKLVNKLMQDVDPR